MEHTAPCSTACSPACWSRSFPKPRRRPPCSRRGPPIRRPSTSTCRRRARPMPTTRRCCRRRSIALPPPDRRHRPGPVRPLSGDRHADRVAGRPRHRLWRDAAGVRAAGADARLPDRARRDDALHERAPGCRRSRRRGRPRRSGQPAARGLPATGVRAGQRARPGRQPDDLLLVDDERRLRDRRRQSGRGRRPLPRRAARDPERHRLPHRIGPRRHHRSRQRRPAPAVRGRPLRDHGDQHVAVLALHVDRLGVRGPARGGDPRAPDRPDGGADDVPQRAGRHQHRQGLLGQPVAEGRAFRARRDRRDRLRPAPERAHPDRGRGRRLHRHQVVRPRARDRPICRGSADAGARLPRQALQPRALRPRPRHDRPHRSAVRRRTPGGGTGAAAARAPCAAADGAVGRRPNARRQGRWQDRRHQGIAGRRRKHSSPLFSVRHVRRPRHHHAEARHGADRAASRHDADRSGRSPGGVRRRRRAEGGAAGAAGRPHDRQRPWRVPGGDQPARHRGAVDGRQATRSCPT